MLRFAAGVCALFSVSLSAFAVSGLDFDFELVAEGFDSPVKVTHAGDDRLFVVETAGVIKVIDGNNTVLNTPFLDINAKVQDGGEKGLLGLVFHPDYANNGYFYVNYTRNGDGDSVIARYSVSTGDPNVADALSEFILLTVNQPAGNHNAGDLAFDPGPNEYLYIPMGDGGNGSADNARDLTNLLGAVIRIDVDSGPGDAPDCVGDGLGGYTVPANGLNNGSGGTCDETWAYGLRNPFRFSIDRATGDLYMGDVGQTSFEEVDFQPAEQDGIDWGWNCKEGFSTYSPGGCSAPGSTDPMFAYGRSDGRSVIGGYVYRGNLYPGLDGIYFFNDFFERTVWAAERNASNNWVVTKYSSALPSSNFSSWGEDADGELYVVYRGFSAGAGDVYQLVDNSAPVDPPVITEGNSIAVTMDEDSNPTGFSLTLNATDDGPAGDLDWSISSQAGNGTGSANGSGASVNVGYSPQSNYNGADSFVVRVTDATGGTDNITVNVTVDPRNDAPTNTTPPSIAGDTETDATVTASPGVWSDDTDQTPGNLSFTYQWERSPDDQNFSDISGATSSSYAIPASDEDQYLRFTVTATDDGEGLPASQTASATSPSSQVTRPNLAPTIQEGVTVDVVMDEDNSPQAFALNLSATDDLPVSELSWTVSIPAGSGNAGVTTNGSPVAVTYTPNNNFNGNDSFTVEVSDAGGKSDSILVNVEIRPRNDAPVNTAQPSITGLATIGATLTGNPGDWNDNIDVTPGSISFDYQWERSADDVSFSEVGGATASTYTIQAGDDGQYLRVVVTATDDGEGLPETQTVVATSNSVEVFANNPPPSILEGPAINIALDEDSIPEPFALNLRAVDDEPSSSLTWRIETPGENGDASVTGSGSPVAVTYTPDSNFNGADTIRVEVADGSGLTDSIRVNITVRPRNDIPVNTSLPSISGSPSVGQTLNASPGSWTDATDLQPGTLTFSYQWRRSANGSDFVDISGATGQSYSPTAGDSGQFVTVVVTATDDGEGSPASQSASATANAVEVSDSGEVVFTSNFELAR